MDVVQQPSRDGLQSVLGEIGAQPRRLVVEAEDTRLDVGLVLSQRLWQKVREPGYIGLNSHCGVFVSHPSMVWMRPETVDGDDAGTVNNSPHDTHSRSLTQP